MFTIIIIETFCPDLIQSTNSIHKFIINYYIHKLFSMFLCTQYLRYIPNMINSQEKLIEKWFSALNQQH